MADCLNGECLRVSVPTKNCLCAVIVMRSAEDLLVPGHLWDSFIISQFRYEGVMSSEMLHCVVE